MQTTITLVSCAAGKCESAAPAAQLYRSDWFTKAKAYAQAQGPWFILSAKHGLVHPDQVIEPYDTTLMRMSKAERSAWAMKVADQVQLLELQADRCIVLAGRLYRDPLTGFLGSWFPAVELPLAGLGIGSQKAKLIQLIKE
jgi:hypothetical protein